MRPQDIISKDVTVSSLKKMKRMPKVWDASSGMYMTPGSTAELERMKGRLQAGAAKKKVSVPKPKKVLSWVPGKKRRTKEERPVSDVARPTSRQTREAKDWYWKLPKEEHAYVRRIKPDILRGHIKRRAKTWARKEARRKPGKMASGMTKDPFATPGRVRIIRGPGK